MMQILPGDKNYNYVMDRLKKVRAGVKVGAYNPPYGKYSKINFPIKVNPPKPIRSGALGGIISAVLKKDTPQEKTEAIYSNPLQITTEYAPFSPSLSEVAPVVIPENPQDEQKSKLSTSGIIGVGLALAAGLL